MFTSKDNWDILFMIDIVKFMAMLFSMLTLIIANTIAPTLGKHLEKEDFDKNNLSINQDFDDDDNRF